jgi:hypothetical protein
MFSPLAAKAVAIARPMPLVDPVMTTVLAIRNSMFRAGLYCSANCLEG